MTQKIDWQLRLFYECKNGKYFDCEFVSMDEDGTSAWVTIPAIDDIKLKFDNNGNCLSSDLFNGQLQNLYMRTVWIVSYKHGLDPNYYATKETAYDHIDPNDEGYLNIIPMTFHNTKTLSVAEIQNKIKVIE